MEKLPDYLIESYIIPYLSSYDLFYKFRSLSSYYYKCVRNKILTHFPGEMLLILKKIMDFNTKEDLAKKFEEILKQTLNEKKVLILLMMQINPSLIINKILENSREQRILELISLFYIVTQNNDMYSLLQQNNINEIQRISLGEEGILDMREKICNVLEEDNLNYDLNEYVTVYESLDREFITGNNYANALYNFLGILIKFCDTKIHFNEIKNKMELFFKQINDASEIWPKKRKFYEKTIDLMADTQILSEGAKIMLKLMKKYEIENDISDYRYEREEIKENNIKESYDIIKSNRKKLNLAILRIDLMHSFFVKCAYPKNVDLKQIKFKIGNLVFSQGDFLYILSMINKKFSINEYSFILTYNHLRHNILCSIYHIHPQKDEKKIDEIIDDKDDNTNNNNTKYIIPTDTDYLDDGISDLKNVLENTKLAGEEINNSFKKFSEDLNNFNTSLI